MDVPAVAASLPAPVAPGDYEVDMRRLSWGELRRMSPSGFAAVVGWVLLKGLRIRLANPARFSYPSPIAPVAIDQLDPSGRAQLEATTADWEAAGFTRAGGFVTRPVVPGGAAATTVWRGADGRAYGQTLWGRSGPPHRLERTMNFLVTYRGDGGRVITTSARQEFDDVPWIDVVRMLGAPIAQLVAAHAERIAGVAVAEVTDLQARLARDSDEFVEHAAARGLLVTARARAG